MKTILFTSSLYDLNRVFSKELINTIMSEFDCDGRIYTPSDLPNISDTEIIFSTWGMPELSLQDLKEYLPSLKCVFYAAGTVKNFAGPFLDNNVKVFCALQKNSVPVAEVTCSEILLASKGFYYLSRICKEDYPLAFKTVQTFPGNYGVKVGLLGYGSIGKMVVDSLKQYDIDIYVSSSKITPQNESDFGVHAASMQEIFENCNVISNHLANVPETVGILNADLFSRMKPYSTFINTGRGAQVDESALAQVLQSDETITAVLDVTFPEPPVPGHPFYSLPNCVLTPHFAGSSGLEVHRMAQYMIDECKNYLSGKVCESEVTRERFEKMALL